MSWHFVRNLLVVLGAYSLAEWLASLITIGEAAMGVEYEGSGRLGELWMYARMSTSSAVAAGAGTALLWFTLGAAATRRWMWGLSALFAVSGLFGRQFQAAAGVVPDPVSRAMEIAVDCLLPTVGCLVAFALLRRFAPVIGNETLSTGADGRTASARSRALVVAWSILMVIAGAFLGLWIFTAADVQRMSGWTVAALEIERRSEYAFTQYREAGYDEAKAALEEFAAYLEALKPASAEWQPGEAPFLDEKGLAFDKMLTYGRLGVRADRANRPDDATIYWQRAEQNAQVLGWEAPTRARIRETVARVDAGQREVSGPPPA